MPRLETWIVFFKGLCFVTIGVFTPWSAALAQWIGTGNWPEKIVWIGVILPASAIGGASQLQSFLSGSFSAYRQAQKDLPVSPTPTTPPADPVAQPKVNP